MRGKLDLHFVTHCVTTEMVKIDKIIWDEWNVEHIARHGVVPSEVEELLHGSYILRESYRGRLKIVGRTKNGRFLAIAVHEDFENSFYLVTARDADLEEQTDYLDEKRKTNGKE